MICKLPDSLLPIWYQFTLLDQEKQYKVSMPPCQDFKNEYILDSLFTSFLDTCVWMRKLVRARRRGRGTSRFYRWLKEYAGSGEIFLLMIKVWLFRDSYLHIHTSNHLALKNWNGVKQWIWRFGVTSHSLVKLLNFLALVFHLFKIEMVTVKMTYVKGMTWGLTYVGYVVSLSPCS